MMQTILDSLTTLLVAVVTAAVPILGKVVWDLVAEKIKASAQTRLSQAASRVAGQVFEQLSTSLSAETAVQAAREALVGRLSQQLTTTMSATVAQLGGTQADVERIVKGELGKLIASAPAVPALPGGAAAALDAVGR